MVEGRIVAEPPEDLRDVARAQHHLAELPILAGKLLDLLQADLVDLVGRELERRVVADHPVVDVGAVGEPRQPDVVFVPGVRANAIPDRVAVGRHRRSNVGLDGLRQAGAPGIRIDDAHRIRGLEERVLGDGLRQPAIDLLDGVVDRERRRRPLPLDALRQPVDHVAEVLRHPVDLADHRLGDVGVRDHELGHEDGEGRLPAEDRIDAELLQPRIEHFRVPTPVEDQHVPGDRVLGRQGFGRDRLGSRGELEASPALLLLAGAADVVEPVGLLVVAHEVAPCGPGGQQELEVLLGERIDVLGHVPSLRAGVPG